MRIIPAIVVCFFVSIPVSAASDTLADEEAAGLKQALTLSVNAAIDILGVPNGFLHNPKAKIPLPVSLQKAEGLMRSVGMNKHADGLIAAMNHAAETAASEGRALLIDAVQNMPVEDAKAILAGGDDGATQYFRNTSSDSLSDQFLPIVKKATEQAGVLKKYNDFAGKGAKLGLISEKHANIENHVTEKTLDGIYLLMAEKEQAIRYNPADQDSELVRRVFGTLK
ncbi:Protein of unknown function [Nitrosospira multiformis]|uniref:DUF4197 domain-containing protein n=1 Tax=Nitrosospira multiformis TaxID=1231 RepID=A0A1H8HSP0_9PROT|nr:DUF4197 domain-containing protein [Nitrosospira multiformis]SEN59133.1 Protein of unknown function [Nitrosospira multiformis]